MRPAHLLHHGLQRHHIQLSPVLGHLGVVDAALDVLVLALSLQQPEALRVTIDEPYNLELRRSRTVVALALALQGAMAEYQADELERVEIDRRNTGW